ncbi:hypothetical protein [Moraxella lacunata]|uniref:hypothetical protein n=1 Tax=Moraxella lacunata TaxID=477 RepID=UPI003EE2FC13
MGNPKNRLDYYNPKYITKDNKKNRLSSHLAVIIKLAHSPQPTDTSVWHGYLYHKTP